MVLSKLRPQTVKQLDFVNNIKLLLIKTTNNIVCYIYIYITSLLFFCIYYCDSLKVKRITTKPGKVSVIPR